MRFQKAIKRMIALGTGAVMLSSVASAAVDLANFPMPFIKDGKFNGYLVVGNKAAAEDVIGTSDVIASLQFSATKKVAASTSGGDVTVEGDAWQVETSNHLELSEEISTGTARETLRNVTTFIDKGDLDALASGQLSNNKGIAPYNQYLYLLSGSATTSSDQTGYVVYTEDDDDKSADFLYFKSGYEIGRYLLEFTTALESDVDDSAGSSSSTGLFLTDFQDVEVTMLGKKYTIVTAKRLSTDGDDVVLTLMGGAGKDTLLEKQAKSYSISGKDFEVTLNFVDADEAQFVINGQTTRKLKDGDTDKLADGTTVGVTDVLYQDYAGGIHSATFFIGAQKLELRDTDINNVVSSNSMKVDDDTIDDATVIIEGSDDNTTFKINRIHVNMTADDNFYVPANGKLSENTDLDEPQVLFTSNWDIEYKGLKKVSTEDIRIKTSGNTQYNLEFVDGDGEKASIPIAKTASGTLLTMGDTDKHFVPYENITLKNDAYFVVTDGSRKRGERKTFALQYKGADKSSADNPVLKFKNLGDGDTIEQTYQVATSLTNGLSEIATLKLGGADFKVFNVSDITQNDFNIVVDFDASGVMTNSVSGSNKTATLITTKNGAEINVTNSSNILAVSQPHVLVTIHTPDEGRDSGAKDSVENVQATDYVLNITASSGEVTFGELTGHSGPQRATKLNLRTPSGETNIAYGYSSYGAFFTKETPTNDPASLKIEYPESQRYPLVYITTKGVSFSESTGVTTTEPVTVQRIQVGAAKLASEVSDVMAQNTILVGGPCANTAAAAVLGNPVDCTEGFEPGVGRIELWEHSNGNVAMLVAGFSAADTRNAAAVVANFGDYKGQLKGMKVKVTKGSGNVLTVTA